MGAEVLACGHSHHLMEVDYMDGSPQVHLHFLTEEKEFTENGYGRLELCCHGCGESLLVLYRDEGSRSAHLKVRDEFHKKHKTCPDRNYAESCPDYRRSSGVVDLRAARFTRKRPAKRRAFA